MSVCADAQNTVRRKVEIVLTQRGRHAPQRRRHARRRGPVAWLAARPHAKHVRRQVLAQARVLTACFGVAAVVITAAASHDSGPPAADQAVMSAFSSAARAGNGVENDNRVTYSHAATGVSAAIAPLPGSRSRSSSEVSDRRAAPAPAATTVSDLPIPALRAYKRAEAVIAATQPECALSWHILAGIGLAESDHGRIGDAVITADGGSVPRVLGPVLNGRGPVAAVPDTDAGRLDGDPVWDRAVGPMQFIPATWNVVAVDGDANGVRDPDDLDDAALAAGVYLCDQGTDLRNATSLAAAIRTYNNSRTYVILVLAYADAYRHGVYPTVPARLLGQVHKGPGQPVTPKAHTDDSQLTGPSRDKPAARRGQGGAGADHHRPTKPQPHQPKPKQPEPAPRPEPPAPGPNPEPDPKPVMKTVVLTGPPTTCGGGGWCVARTYAGDLAAWRPVVDYDGDCRRETMTHEVEGLAEVDAVVRIRVRQTIVDGDVTATVTMAFQVVDRQACDDDSVEEATPTPPTPSPTPAPEPSSWSRLPS